MTSVIGPASSKPPRPIIRRSASSDSDSVAMPEQVVQLDRLVPFLVHGDSSPHHRVLVRGLPSGSPIGLSSRA